MDAPKPFCSKCQRYVDSATSLPIFKEGQQIGRKLTYACHGETEQLEVAEGWFHEAENLNKPFVASAFAVHVSHSSGKTDLPEQFADLIREQTKAIYASVDQHIRSLLQRIFETTDEAELLEIVKNRGEIRMPAGSFGFENQNVFIDNTLVAVFSFDIISQSLTFRQMASDAELRQTLKHGKHRKRVANN